MADAQQSAVTSPAATGRWGPPPALTGFAVLLLAMFALAYGVGSAAGPVAPGLRSTVGEAGPSGRSGDGGSGNTGGHTGGGR
ncbi:hypothetical protein ACFCYM_12915 [Streptomyces sp. NPDC056254]|uniref:hypothetical protein n=1 Tax=unclassified Streptomyces TaxID=2593676 RepID=UPI00056C11A1|nr:MULTISPECIES: hypothetical protein [unclassified Streptomyces]APU43535.1 hypothetical protein BSL84_31115 [Streptomyces sp. TN58]KJK48653.1 hypothetical protein UK14_17715 [Streptomyces sp. NRRL F-4428]